MALSDDALWAIIDAVPGCEEHGDGGAWLISVIRAVEAEVRKQDTELIRQMRDALESAKPVYATSKNTTAVALSYEVGGYVKHYTILPHAHHAALTAANARLEGKP